MTTPGHVVSVGADLFADAVSAQAIDVTRVDWRPPMPGTRDDLADVAGDPLRRAADLGPAAAQRPTRSRSTNLLTMVFS